MMNHLPVRLRRFPPHSQRQALRAGARHRCCRAVLARWPLVWAAWFHALQVAHSAIDH